MKKLLLVLFVACTWVQVLAQVQLVMAPSNPFEYTISDWLQFTAINPSTSEVPGHFQGNIRDGQSGDVLVSFVSENVRLVPGSQLFTEKLLKIKRLDHKGGSLSSALISGKGLLPGRYVACIKFVSEQRNGAEMCQEVEVMPLLPPMLNYPANGSSITEHQPQFLWTPAVVKSGAGNMQYELVLVEKRNNQSAMEALSRNRPIYKERNIKRNVQPYPSSANMLESDKIYVWQVKAYYHSAVAGVSDVFSFEIAEDEAYSNIPDTQWVEVGPYGYNGRPVCRDYVMVSFKHFVPSESLDVKITNDDGDLLELPLDGIEPIEGTGRLLIHLGDIVGIKRNEVYHVEFKRRNNQKMGLNITYKG